MEQNVQNAYSDLEQLIVRIIALLNHLDAMQHNHDNDKLYSLLIERKDAAVIARDTLARV